jgi:hypothetical protein
MLQVNVIEISKHAETNINWKSKCYFWASLQVLTNSLEIEPYNSTLPITLQTNVNLSHFIQYILMTHFPKNQYYPPVSYTDSNSFFQKDSATKILYAFLVSSSSTDKQELILWQA